MSTARQRAIAILVAGCFFMENLDGTIVTTAAPAIADALGTDAAAVGLTVTAFLLAFAVLIPASGWLSERVGVRRVFAIAIAVFTLASLLCALSPTLELLVASRIVQGLGAALMVPVGRMAVLSVTPKSGIIRAIAILVWPGLVAPIIAPYVGGLLTQYASWHWIFLINLPLGVIAFITALRIVPNTETPHAAPLDLRGFALVAVGLGSLVFGSSRISETQTDLLGFAVFAGLGVVVTLLAVWHLLRAANPLLRLDVFRFETFRIANASGSVYRATISAVPFVLPLMFQQAFGWSPVDAGAMLLWLFVGNLAIKPATTWMLRALGFRLVLVLSNLVGVACMLVMAYFTPATPVLAMIAVLTLSGVARSSGFTAYATITFADLDDADRSSANTLNATMQQLAGGIGVAIGGLAIACGFMLGAGLVPYRFALLALAALTCIPLIASMRLSRGAGSALTA